VNGGGEFNKQDLLLTWKRKRLKRTGVFDGIEKVRDRDSGQPLFKFSSK
jgi:hypothetical protein